MLRRIELAWPVTDAKIRQRIIDECLVAYLHDGVDAWELQSNGHYTRVNAGQPSHGHGAQAALVARYATPERRKK
jgi:polyphosphate kinase